MRYKNYPRTTPAIEAMKRRRQKKKRDKRRNDSQRKPAPQLYMALLMTLTKGHHQSHLRTKNLD